ncbi:phosphoadenosine phosphosulfate reductase [Mycobacterium malmoense]|uniref:Adenosine 5'-phosphosulfate reductase n=2 Tax=Mycobacterium malmoense TaxID=1780 RepID=A0A1B9D8L9_MYCMA|nr:phosphoadenosine phosphosulfate reductase [Mycobacterium malmoense]OCB35670.1 phosphoadenosine phosphosulfate reductase [Mycobacterium malmoense]OCB36748.1 phosphoadenosine phosphosulfate reductase [Mycobacterium malmoense]OCB54730.1 phosphoadenosine phosphosulfate reductase [Mycobacterium malmoense]
MNFTSEQLRQIAERGAAELEGASADEILRWTDEQFGGADAPRGWANCKWVVACNMQDAVTVSLASNIRPGVPVLFLDTGYHFAETLGTRDAVESVYDIHLLNVKPEHTVEEQDALLGKDLFSREPNECCRLRKVVPLKKALNGYAAWVTGLRRVESPTRADAPLISFDESFGLVKVNPIAAWTDEDEQDYIDKNGVLINPLVEEGYPSIGCAPCTRKPAPGEDPRSGRWAGRNKTECGLHAS